LLAAGQGDLPAVLAIRKFVQVTPLLRDEPNLREHLLARLDDQISAWGAVQIWK
jgi:hypothetical protein